MGSGPVFPDNWSVQCGLRRFRRSLLIPVNQGEPALRTRFHFLLFPQPVFGALEQPFDIAFVAPEGEAAGGEGEKEEGDFPVARDEALEEDGGGERHRRDEGADRDVAGEADGDSPEDEGEDDGDGHERHEAARGGGDAFAAFEVEPEGEVVAEDGGDDGQDGDDSGGFHVLSEDAGEQSGDEAFQHVEAEDGQANRFSEDADDVGGADVSAAVFADVDAFGFAGEESERGRSDDVAEQEPEVGEPNHA